MSHTTHDYVNGDPKLWIIHNSDFSGECLVGWTIEGKDKSFTYEWRVDGDMLLTGNIMGTQVDNQANPVPYWVMGRAVQLAVRTIMSRKIINFVGDL